MNNTHVSSLSTSEEAATEEEKLPQYVSHDRKFMDKNWSKLMEANIDNGDLVVDDTGAGSCSQSVLCFLQKTEDTDGPGSDDWFIKEMRINRCRPIA